MRILFITSSFPSPIEPTKAVFNLRMVEAIAREHEVRVVAPISWVDEWRASNGLLPSDRCRVVGGVEIHHPRYYYPPKIMRSHYGRFYWRSIRETVEQLVAEQGPDLILGYWAHPDGEAALRAARLARVPCIVMVGGSDVLILARNQARRRQIRSVLRASDAVVATSRHLRDKLTELGVAPARIHVIYRGVDGNRFRPSDRIEARRKLGIPPCGAMLLCVGRMVPVKGLDVLLAACTELRRRGDQFRLYLVGDGPLRAQIEADAAKRGLLDAVSLVGSVPHEQMPDWYRAADLTVHSSRSEGVPNVLRESLACGTPFIASDVGGIREIADGDSCMLVPPGDALALADGIAATLARGGTASTASKLPDWDESAEALTHIARSLIPAEPRAAEACST